MSVTSSATPAPVRSLPVGERLLALAAVGVLAGLVAAAAIAGLDKLVVIALVSSAAMALGGVLALRGAEGVRATTWAYGLASGAMVASTAAFLLPVAIRNEPQLGGFGIATGLLAGFAVHAAGDRLAERATTLDDTIVRLTAHALAAGVVIGVIYASLPGTGLLLGLSIVSHKGPAGYAAARRLRAAGRSSLPLALPATGVGVPALILGLVGATVPQQASALVFGFAAGVFLHVAIDFLPSGGQDGRLRPDAAASTAFGALAVVVAWIAVSAL